MVTHPSTNLPACGLCAVNRRVGASKPVTLALQLFGMGYFTSLMRHFAVLDGISARDRSCR